MSHLFALDVPKGGVLKVVEKLAMGKPWLFVQVWNGWGCCILGSRCFRFHFKGYKAATKKMTTFWTPQSEARLAVW